MRLARWEVGQRCERLMPDPVPELLSEPRYTTPIPPRPSSPSIRYPRSSAPTGSSVPNTCPQGSTLDASLFAAAHDRMTRAAIKMLTSRSQAEERAPTRPHGQRRHRAAGSHRALLNTGLANLRPVPGGVDAGGRSVTQTGSVLRTRTL